MKREVQKTIWDREQIARIDEGNDRNRRRIDQILQKIKILSAGYQPSSISVLNIGIGNGLMENYLLRDGFKTYSLDPSQNAVSLVSQKLNSPTDQFRTGSCSSIPFDTGEFDFVVMSEVIEHLDDTTLADTMSELKRVLKHGGRFIGTCPDSEDVEGKTNTCPYCGERFHRVGHVRSFTKGSLNTFLKDHFIVEDCYSFRGMELNRKGTVMYWYNTLPYRLARLVKPSISIPQHLGQHLFFVGRKSA